MFTCIFASCSDGGSEEPVTPPTEKPEVNNTPTITIDPTIQSSGLSFDTSASEKSITFSTTSDWTLSIAETRSGTEWCTASPTSGGKGTATVKFKTTENTESEDRSVAVTIKAGTASKTFTVTQKGTDVLLITTTKYEVPQEGGDIEIEVKSNIDYQMEISESAKSWITEISNRALATHKHIFNIAFNEDTEKREGEITFKSGDIVETVKVYQAGEAVLLLSKNEFTVSEAGETISVDIKSNVEFGVQMPNADWIKEDATGRGMSSHTLKFVIDANMEEKDRSAKVIFYEIKGNLSDTLLIKQHSKINIILSNKYLDVSPVGISLFVSLNDKIGWCDIDINQCDWITLNNQSLYKAEFSIGYNNRSNESRTANIIFRNKERNITDTLTINQAAPGGYLHSYLTQKYGDYFLGINCLKIDFPIGGGDQRWLRQMMGGSEFSNQVWGKLSDLDMSDATIVWREEKCRITNNNGLLENVTYRTNKNIVSGYSNCNNLRSIYLPNNGDVISTIAFEGCSKLEEVNFGDGINQIGDGAFKNCSNLKNIKLPDNIVTLGKSIFEGCHLEYVILGNKIEKIGDYAFYNCDLKNIDIPNNVTRIGESAFAQCIKLNANLSKNLKVLDKSAFSGCYNLYLELPNELEIIGDEVFAKNGFEKIKIPNSVKVIGKKAFYRCLDLKIVELGNGVTELVDGVFEECYNLESVILTDNLTSIGTRAFYDCMKLNNIELPSDVTSIGNQAFSGCTILKNMQLENVEHIGDGAFQDCKSFSKDIKLDKILSIGKDAFYGCNSLNSVMIGKGLEVISDGAFKNCKKLKKVVLGENITKIGKGAFSNTIIESFYINTPKPPKVSEAFDKTWSWGQDSFRILYVPKGALEAYKSSEWKYYFDGINEMD